jgi:hypothetical protein
MNNNDIIVFDFITFFFAKVLKLLI